MKSTILLLSAIIMSIQLKAQERASVGGPKIPVEDCRELIEYRDTKLLQIWDKTVEKYVIPEKAIADLNKYKEQLSDDTWYATTDLHVATLTIKLASNTVEDLLNIVAPLKAAAVSLILTVTGAKYLEYDTKRRDILASDDAVKATAKFAALEVAALTPFGAIPKLLDNLIDNLNAFNDYSNVKSEVTFQLKNFDRAIKNYNNKVIPLKANLEEVNEYKKYIDDYLKENCANMPAQEIKPENTYVYDSKEIWRKNIPGASLLATYQDQIGQWIAIGPYETTVGFPSEQAAIESMLYTHADFTLVNDKGKFKIYTLNLKAEHDARDVREILKKLGAENIPD